MTSHQSEYAGKIKLDNLDIDIFTEFQFSEDTKAISIIVNSKSLMRDVLIIVERKTDQKGKKHKDYFFKLIQK